MKNLARLMHCCSDQEAFSMGLFFSEMFEQLDKWTNRATWNRECEGNCQFSKHFNGEHVLSYEQFSEKVVENFHNQFIRLMMTCLDKNESNYMKSRCALLILNRMTDVFPKSLNAANLLQERL